MIYRWILFGVACSSFLFSPPAKASTYLDLDDPAYMLFSRLEAEGVIRTGLLATRPISRKEAERLLEEAEENADGRTAFIKSLVRELAQRLKPGTPGSRIKPVDSLYVKYGNTNAAVRTLTYTTIRETEQALNYNNDGILYGHGSHGQAGLTSRAEDLGRFSCYLNPEFFAAQGEKSDLSFRKGYAVFDLGGWDLIAGKNSQWWGPGYNGAILLSNNAEPFSMLQITNPVPDTLPGIFSALGPYRFAFFVTRLEKDRADIPEPYLWGMRVNFKPHPNLEIGLQRTALLGGRDRPTNVNTWLHSLFGTNEHSSSRNPGDQRAGYDLKLTLPFDLQPLQVYGEAAGEDNRQRHARLPYKLATLYGMYLPRVLGFERISLRTEYAANHVKDWPNIWYTHQVYTAGYTYHGQIIGHQMGTDSRDLFAMLAYAFPENQARVSLAFDRTVHNLSFAVNEKETGLSLRAAMNLSEKVDLDLTYGCSWIQNAEFVSGVERRSHAAGGIVTRRF